MIKKICLCLCLVGLVGCAKSQKINNGNQPNKIFVEESNREEKSSIIKINNNKGLDFSGIKYLPSETAKDEKLEEAFAELYNFKKGEDEVRYYYNKIDLNGDRKEEIFVYLVGPMVCGTGGCSSLIFLEKDGKYELHSRFTLVNNPIIISDEASKGWKDIIMYVAGGGEEEGYVKMQYNGEKYPMNPTVQEKIQGEAKIEGTAIIADDISENQGIRF